MSSKHIIIEAPVNIQQDEQAISLEQYLQKRKRRRWRVADRMLKRAPLFAVELMQHEFPGYTNEQFIADVTRKRSKSRGRKKGKSPLKRQGRYRLMMKAIADYRLTKDENHLALAQKLRQRMFLPMQIEFYLNKEKRTLTFPSTTSVEFVQSLTDIKFKTWAQLDEILDERLKYSHVQ